MAAEKKPNVAPNPLIPEKYLDIPSQRLYYLSLGGLIQGIKLVDFVRYLTSSDLNVCRKWLLVDLAYCLVLAWLRIPRLRYSTAVILLQIACLWFLDGLIFGGIHFNVSSGITTSGGSGADTFGSAEPWGIMSLIAPLTFGLFGVSEAWTHDAHLLGQHTVRMQAIGTAKLNPQGINFCLSPQSKSVLIPVLLNNTNPASLQFSLTPLGRTNNDAVVIDLSGKELKAIEKDRLDGLQVAKPAPVLDTPDEYEYDDEEDDLVAENSRPLSSLQKSQSLVHIRISRPGTIRLESVTDASETEARIVYPSEMVIAPCPHVEFVPTTDEQTTSCLGQNPDVELMLDIRGVPPLSLRWFKTLNGKRENFNVQAGTGDDKVAQQLRVPLAISLDKTGTHTYGLEEVTDGIGNVVQVNAPPDSSGSSATLRTFQVLRRPSMSFKHCSPGNPTAILVGSDTGLSIGANEVDMLDAPWDVSLKYQPADDDKESKRFKAWKKNLTTQPNRKDLSIRATAPGYYTITGVKGKWCEGDVLAPETCQVIERPHPTAEIEWKKIHECSGNTGVSASLLFHGTPPFKVYFREQLDKGPPHETSRTFASSRGEFSVQPADSGHYTFSFTQLSDQYYKVPLPGPSIDQVIHPLAAAEFASGRGSGKSKKSVSSCEGGLVDVDVDLRGTGPWTIEIQTVGPKSSDIITIPGIETSRKTLQIPIPKKIDKEGGTFEIELLSVEDKYKCKRDLSVPGISVNVRRVKPTVRFYGDKDKRRVTVLERERVSLPLRLTGEGPWRVKYKRMEAPGVVLTARLVTPNDQLQVTEKGLYELVEVSDLQCAGTVITEASQYLVDWVPRPSAELSKDANAYFERYNASYIISPICENVADHVDLELIGRPPFQIMYNIAQGAENGNTKLLNQPVFNSLQHRTRFELQTSQPGRMYYEVKQIGDGAYPLAKHKDAIIPRSQRLVFEQQVYMRPSARFRNRNRLSHCLNDVFVPSDPSGSDGVILFEGTPPFRLELSIKNLISSKADFKTIETNEVAWRINLPSYIFQSIGPHLVKVESVSDALGCQHAELDPLATSIWVDVAETAAIVPFDRREDFCVGEVAQFQLEGIPPWTVGYRVNGKANTQEVKQSPFSFTQQSPGEFSVVSISHQQKLCKASVTNLQFHVHPLPSAQVGHGKRIYQDIHEGDQAEIVFTLIGEPPFTFTYQRSELSPKKGGKPGKVLETHTVSRVFSKEYSIFSALEGTWTVTSISDKYCRYPPAQAEAKGDTKNA